MCVTLKERNCCGKNNTKESLDMKERRRIEKGVVLLLDGVACEVCTCPVHDEGVDILIETA